MTKELLNNTTNKEQKENQLLIFTCAIIGMLIFLGTNSALFTVTAFLLCSFVCVQFPLDFSFSVMLFILPMATIFKLAPGQASLFTFAQLIWVVCAFWKSDMQATKTDAGIILFSFYLIICQIFNGGLSISATLKLTFGLFMVVAIKKRKLYGSYTSMFLCYISGVFVSSLLMYIDLPLFKITTYVSSKTERLVGAEVGDNITRFAGLYGDPNYYSVNVIIAMILILCLYRKKKLTSIQSVIMTAPFVFFAAKTGSKSALFMLVIPAILFICISLKNRHYIIACASMIVVVFAVWMILNGKIAAFSVAIQRLTANHASLNELTTGRGSKWTEFLKYIWERPVVLVFGKSLLNVVLNGGAPHNTYIDMLFQLGVFGTIWIVGILGTAWIDKHKNKTMLNYSLAGAVAILYFFLSELQYADFAFHLALCLIVANLDFNSNLKMEDE